MLSLSSFFADHNVYLLDNRRIKFNGQNISSMIQWSKLFIAFINVTVMPIFFFSPIPLFDSKIIVLGYIQKINGILSALFFLSYLEKYYKMLYIPCFVLTKFEDEMDNFCNVKGYSTLKVDLILSKVIVVPSSVIISPTNIIPFLTQVAENEGSFEKSLLYQIQYCNSSCFVFGIFNWQKCFNFAFHPLSGTITLIIYSY